MRGSGRVRRRTNRLRPRLSGAASTVPSTGSGTSGRHGCRRTTARGGGLGVVGDPHDQAGHPDGPQGEEEHQERRSTGACVGSSRPEVALGGSSEVRWAARQALEAKGDLAALALMRVVRSSEAAMASDAAAALTGFAVHAPRQLLPFLEESLHHKLWDVRYCGLWGLRFYGKQASFAAPSVRALLNDPTANVAMMARETLAVIQ